MRCRSDTSKALRARELGVSVRSLYYKPKQPNKDWILKCDIETVLREHPSYGLPRIAIALKRNHKPVERIMKLFGIKAYRRRGKRWKKTNNIKVIYPNLLLTTYPQYENHIWVSDFTYIPFQGRFVYVATVEDLFTRKVVGLSVYTTQGSQLVVSAFMSAINNNSIKFFSDNPVRIDNLTKSNPSNKANATFSTSLIHHSTQYPTGIKLWLFSEKSP